MSGNAVIGALRVALGMDSAAFEKGASAAQRRLNAFERRLKAVSRRMKSIGRSMSLAVTAPLTGLVYKSVAAMKEQEQAIAAVDAALASMGDKAGFTSQELQDMASALQENSLFGDEAILQKVTANLLTFGNISGDVFQRTQQMALDLSARLGQDLQSSAVMLGKALNDPVQGLTALSRVGVSFTEQQKAMIKEMAQAGNVAGAQALMLDLLEEQYKGQAAALANTDSGKITQAWNAIGDAMEKIGAIILPILADMAQSVKSAAEWFQQLSPDTQAFIVKAGLLAAALGPLITGLGLFLGAVKPIAAAVAAVLSPIGLTVLAIGALGFVIYNNWETIKSWAADIPRLARAAIDGISNAFSNAVEAVTNAIKSVWAAIVAEVSSWPGRMKQYGLDMINALFDGITGASAAEERARLQAEALAQHFGDGVVIGLQNSKPDLEAGMAEISDYLEKVAREENEIQSPSRRYARIGEMLMQGLGMGIRGGTAAAAAQMSQSAQAIAAEMQIGTAEGLGDSVAGIENAMQRLGQTSGGVFQRMGRWLVDLVKGATTLGETLINAARNFANSLGQQGMAGLGNILTGSMGQTTGGLLTGIIGGLLGFANGGSFEVGGTGGIDSQIVAFRASPDERVTITKPGQSIGNSGGGMARVAVDISVDDDGKLVAIARQAGAEGALPVAVGVLEQQREAQRRA